MPSQLEFSLLGRFLELNWVNKWAGCVKAEDYWTSRDGKSVFWVQKIWMKADLICVSSFVTQRSSDWLLFVNGFWQFSLECYLLQVKPSCASLESEGSKKIIESKLRMLVFFWYGTGKVLLKWHSSEIRLLRVFRYLCHLPISLKRQIWQLGAYPKSTTHLETSSLHLKFAKAAAAFSNTWQNKTDF